MAQINLLKQSQPSGLSNLGIFPVLSKFALLFALLLVAYYGVVYFQIKSANKQIVTLTERIAEQEKELAEIPRRNEVLTRQAQALEQDKLVSSHAYWSQLLPELAKVTLKQANYLSFRAVTDGGLNLSVRVPSIAELDKFLQVFNSPQLNKYFSDVKIGGINKVQEETESYVRVEAQLKYDPGLLKYKESTK